MEKTIATIDVNEPMRMVSSTGTIINVLDVLFHNDDVCLCIVDLDGLNPHYLFDKKTGKLLNETEIPWHVENYAPVGEPEPLTLSQRARQFAQKNHRLINQTYAGRPYMYHVDMAADAARMFRHLIPEEKFEIALSGTYLHDTHEDPWCTTYNDLKKEFGTEVADIAFACSNEKGKTRKERANAKYYQGIRDTPFASFVKVCDRIANIQHGVESIANIQHDVENSDDMLSMYRKEHKNFVYELYTKELKPMFDHMEKLLS